MVILTILYKTESETSNVKIIKCLLTRSIDIRKSRYDDIIVYKNGVDRGPMEQFSPLRQTMTDSEPNIIKCLPVHAEIRWCVLKFCQILTKFQHTPANLHVKRSEIGTIST